MEENQENVNENVQTEEKALTQVRGFGELQNNSKTKCYIQTNITDQKQIFNLEANVDYKINDCKGELIRVKQVLVKTYEKPLAEPVIDEETGEILKDKEIKRVCILIDDNGKSYVTGSHTFTLAMLKYINMFGTEAMETEGVEIRIIETAVKNSSNKALNFELV